MARFPSIDSEGAFEAPEVQNNIKELVTGSTDGITVDNTVGTRVFVGDTMIYGDTGDRVIVHLVDPLIAVEEGVSVPRAYMRRENSQVFLSIRLKIAPELTGKSRNSWFSLFPGTVPDGFRPTPASYGPAYSGPVLNTAGSHSSEPADFFLSTVSGASTLTLRGESGVWQSNDILSFQTSWTTQQSWPTSLPGTPL